MYDFGQIKKGLLNPNEVAWELHSKSSRLIFNRNDEPIPERDWDNLILLDACRYDLFEDVNTLSGNLEKYYSVASSTAEYVWKTFNREEYPEIVCVTATPKYYKPTNVEDSFHDLIHVWKDDWDEEYGTVLPEVMNERVLEVTKKYPNKRILAHYIPPHQPFIGETGQSIPHGGTFSGIRKYDIDSPNIFDALRENKHDKDKVWKAYKENLEITLPAINKILEKLRGKTVVTSDHGNVFDDVCGFDLIGHPGRRHIKPLIEVPWLVNQNGNRKTIERGHTTDTSEDMDDTVVQERLSDLGYLE
jgi:hypothetical protein